VRKLSIFFGLILSFSFTAHATCSDKLAAEDGLAEALLKALPQVPGLSFRTVGEADSNAMIFEALDREGGAFNGKLQLRLKADEGNLYVTARARASSSEFADSVYLSPELLKKQLPVWKAEYLKQTGKRLETSVMVIQTKLELRTVASSDEDTVNAQLFVLLKMAELARLQGAPIYYDEATLREHVLGDISNGGRSTSRGFTIP
jgi:hypothetical protein